MAPGNGEAAEHAGKTVESTEAEDVVPQLKQPTTGKPASAPPHVFATVSYGRWTKDSDLEAQKKQHSYKNYSWATTMFLSYSAIGVIFGDIGTSPLYTYSSTFTADWPHGGVPTELEILGAASLIVWTLTLGTVIKYLMIVVLLDDNGEGGTFALYSLLCRALGLSPSLSALALDSDTHLSVYGQPDQQTTAPASRKGFNAKQRLRTFFQRSPLAKAALLSTVLLMTSMVLGDGVLTPAQSVLGAIYGLQVKKPSLGSDVIVGVSCAIIVLIFAAQRFGTSRVGAAFAPIVLLWFAFNIGVSIYNIHKFYPSIFKAISPHYGYYFFHGHPKAGWVHLSGIFLSITGSEALYADLGHFSRTAVRVSFLGIAYPSLVLTYLGQAAWIQAHPDQVSTTFYASIPGGDGLYWVFFAVATAAACVASQAMISGVFSIVRQSMALGCFPRLTVKHTSKKVHGEIYIPEVSFVMMVLTVVVVIIFKTTTQLGNAYGVCVSSMMLGTTWLVFLAMLVHYEVPLWAAVPFLMFYTLFDAVYISSNLNKVPHGGWFALAVAGGVGILSHIWHWGSALKHQHTDPPKDALVDTLTVGAGGAHGERALLFKPTNTPVPRLPGLALLYSENILGVPALLPAMLSKFGALHSTVVIVTVRHVAVPTVPVDERMLLLQMENYPGVFRCIARYGYQDSVAQTAPFITKLVQKVLLADPSSDAGRHLDRPVYITLRPIMKPRPGSNAVRRALLAVYGGIARVVAQPYSEWDIPLASLLEVGTILVV